MLSSCHGIPLKVYLLYIVPFEHSQVIFSLIKFFFKIIKMSLKINKKTIYKYQKLQRCYILGVMATFLLKLHWFQTPTRGPCAPLQCPQVFPCRDNVRPKYNRSKKAVQLSPFSSEEVIPISWGQNQVLWLNL